MLTSWSNDEDFSGQIAPEVSRIQEAVASIRKERVAYKIQEQLAQNLKAAERDLDRSRESIARLQTGAAEAVDALLRGERNDAGENYERVKAALQLLEREVGEALIAADWFQDSRKMLDTHGVRSVS